MAQRGHTALRESFDADLNMSKYSLLQAILPRHYIHTGSVVRNAALAYWFLTATFGLLRATLQAEVHR
jgi:hypothetical protein